MSTDVACLLFFHRQRHSDSYGSNALLGRFIPFHHLGHLFFSITLLARKQSSQHHDSQHQDGECSHDYRHPDYSYQCRVSKLFSHTTYDTIGTTLKMQVIIYLPSQAVKSMYWLVLEVESAIRLGHETYCSSRHDRTVVTEYLVLPILTIV